MTALYSTAHGTDAITLIVGWLMDDEQIPTEATQNKFSRRALAILQITLSMSCLLDALSRNIHVGFALCTVSRDNARALAELTIYILASLILHAPGMPDYPLQEKHCD